MSPILNSERLGLREKSCAHDDFRVYWYFSVTVLFHYEELAKQFLPIRQVTADSAAIVGHALRFATKPSDLRAP